MQTAFALKEAEETFGKLGVRVGGSELDFPAASAWKDAIVKQLTSGVAGLFKANGVQWLRGTGTFTGPNSIAVEGDEEVRFAHAIVATGSYPLRPPIEGIDGARCVDSTGLLAVSEVPSRLVVLGGGIIGCEFASIFNRFGSAVTIVELLPMLIPQEDEEASAELAKQLAKRGVAIHLGARCDRVEDTGEELRVTIGGDATVECDLMLVATGRRRLVEGIGLEAAGRVYDRQRRRGQRRIAERTCRTSSPSATAPATGSSPTPRSAKGEVAAENACGHAASVDNRACRGRSIPATRSPAWD